MALELRDFVELAARVETAAPLSESRDHGSHHWRLVAWTGAELLDETEGTDPLVVLLFALFHDSQRVNEHADPEHGPRGGALARRMLDTSNWVSASQLDVVEDACRRHTKAGPTDDATLGVCWDADRLNLWRVGKKPDPRYLSTPAAKRRERIERARKLQSTDPDWPDVFRRYGF